MKVAFVLLMCAVFVSSIAFDAPSADDVADSLAGGGRLTI